MSIARRKRRESERRFAYFGELLMGFYEFLEQTPKPTDEGVRKTFIETRSKWVKYCAVHQLSKEASDLFTKEVASSWKTRYTASTKE